MTTENKAAGKPALRELAREIATELATNKFPHYGGWGSDLLIPLWSRWVEAKLEAFLAQPAPIRCRHCDKPITEVACGWIHRNPTDRELATHLAEPAAPLAPESPPPVLCHCTRLLSGELPSICKECGGIINAIPESAAQVSSDDQSRGLEGDSDRMASAAIPSLTVSPSDSLESKPEAAPLGVPVTSKLQELNRALRALYLEVDSRVGDDVKMRVNEYLAEVAAETRRLREELDKLREELAAELDADKELQKMLAKYQADAEQAESALAQARQWIPMSEQLPAVGQRIVVYCPTARTPGYVVNWRSSFTSEAITHWIPLPDTPATGAAPASEEPRTP